MRAKSNIMMKDLYSPENLVELTILKSILDGERIYYFVHNEHFSSLKVGPYIQQVNTRMIRVHEDHYDRAKELIDDYLQNMGSDENERPGSKYTFFDRVRIVLEFFVFSWIMPRKNTSYSDLDD